MNVILIILIVILIVIIASLCRHNLHSGGVGDYVLPFTQVDVKSKDFTDVINNREIISKVHAFLQYDKSRVLKSFVSQYAPSIEVLNELYSDNAYNKLMARFNLANKDDGQKLKEHQQLGLADLVKYKRNSGRVIQPASVLSTDTPTGGLHATAVLVDYKNASIVYLDPHFHYTSPFSYNNFLNIREKIITAVPELKDFWYGNMHEVTGFSSACPIFQGSFKEEGLCPMWSMYLLLLFAINSGPKFASIVKMHERNPRWTQRNLQQFIYNVYKRFKSEIDKIELDNDKFKITGETSFGNVKGKYACTSHGWFWSEKDKKCYETERDWSIAEGNYYYRDKSWKEDELIQHLQNQINSTPDEYKEALKNSLKYANVPDSIISKLQ